jgi:hypothetical protein
VTSVATRLPLLDGRLRAGCNGGLELVKTLGDNFSVDRLALFIARH